VDIGLIHSSTGEDRYSKKLTLLVELQNFWLRWNLQCDSCPTLVYGSMVVVNLLAEGLDCLRDLYSPRV